MKIQIYDILWVLHFLLISLDGSKTYEVLDFLEKERSVWFVIFVFI